MATIGPKQILMDGNSSAQDKINAAKQLAVGNGYSDNDISVQASTESRITVIFRNRTTNTGDKQGFLIDTAKEKIKAVVIRTLNKTQDADIDDAIQTLRESFAAVRKKPSGIREPSFPQDYRFPDNKGEGT